MISGSWERTTLQDVGSRFASGEHAVSPAPSTLLTRWHDPSAKRFWLVVNRALSDDEVGELLVGEAKGGVGPGALTA